MAKITMNTFENRSLQETFERFFDGRKAKGIVGKSVKSYKGHFGQSKIKNQYFTGQAGGDTGLLFSFQSLTGKNSMKERRKSVMYSRIGNLSMDLYDPETHELLGATTFMLPSSEEKKLLDLVNYGVRPTNLLVVNANLYNPSPNYSPSNPAMPLKRAGVIKALFTESDTKVNIPLEIRIKFDSRVRGVIPGNPYRYSSVDFGNIEVESVKPMY